MGPRKRKTPPEPWCITNIILSAFLSLLCFSASAQPTGKLPRLYFPPEGAGNSG